MYAILISAGGALVRWLFSAGAVKFGFGAVLWAGLAGLLSLLTSLIPSWFGSSGLTGYANGFTASMWYFMDVFKIADGLSLTLSAYGARFLIRRIPFIG